MSHRDRNSPKARRICFERHKYTDHCGRIMLKCHWGDHPIDPVRDRWRADHIRRHAEDGDESADNLWPICEACDRQEKAPLDTKEVAKGKRMGARHFGIKTSRGFYKPKDVIFNWSRRRYEKKEDA